MEKLKEEQIKAYTKFNGFEPPQVRMIQTRDEDDDSRNEVKAALN